MLIAPNGRYEVGRLARSTGAGVSAGVFAEIVAASPRLITLRTMGKTERLDRLVTCEAWTEAAMELIALEVPAWSIQRLCRDDREWLCALTRFPDIPDWLDDTAEGRNTVMALAMLDALLDARTRNAAAPLPGPRQPAGMTADCADYR